MNATGETGEVPDGREAAQDGGHEAVASRLRKSPSAFRTISEVADELHIPQHVLRFWETRFPQVKPLKRGGGRRYYRPDDIALLRSISHLLYIQGYTIKGVQRLLREGGGALADDIPPASDAERHESDMAGAVDAAETGDTLESEAELAFPPVPPVGRPGADFAEARAVPASGEAERLRAVLRETLRELEALRALIPG